MPSSNSAASKIEKLRDEIRRHEYLYYVLDQPELSDAQFDKLMIESQGARSRAPQPDHSRLTDSARGRDPARRLPPGAARPADDEPRQRFVL